MLGLGCWYYIADYVPMPSGPGFTPALPDGTGFVLLAGPSDGPKWGIFACDNEVDLLERAAPVPTDLEEILESGRRYPPALALARDDATQFVDGPGMSRADFVARYAERVVHHLNRQRNAPYLIGEAVVEEPGYLRCGQWYWVLRYLRGTNEVRWVSDDFQVYQNAASDFRLSANELDRLLMPFEGAV
jgi:hypothetical protein